MPIHHVIKATKKTMKPKAKLRFIAPEADETRPQIKRTRTLNTVSDKINRTTNKTWPKNVIDETLPPIHLFHILRIRFLKIYSLGGVNRRDWRRLYKVEGAERRTWPRLQHLALCLVTARNLDAVEIKYRHRYFVTPHSKVKIDTMLKTSQSFDYKCRLSCMIFY